MTDPSRPRWVRWPRTVAGPGGPGPLAYGADYNPEQWPRETWKDDVRLMQQAGVNIVSLGIFSWATLQPSEDTWDFAWLDDVMDLLHDHGIAVDLATATASPPPWLTTKHPEILPVDHAGSTVWPGARQHWRPTSPVFRRYALALAESVARRYADHPALAAWHVSNELGCHNVHDYSDDAAAAFRVWLQERYSTLDALNHAWGTAFWSQRYGDWAEILPPRLAAANPNPTQQLDFKRFSSDALKDYLRAECAVLHRVTPDVPVTTNFMVMDGDKGLDFADWAGEVDFVSNDHYVVVDDRALDELSYSANLTSGMAGGERWFLMEHSTSAVNWRATNPAKPDGALVRDSLTHVAHGADAVCFFQWRQSAAGAEKYHSAMVPHAGEDTEVFRTVTRLGQHLRRLAPVSGTRRKPARVAVLFDLDSWWAAEQDSHPNASLDYRREGLDWYAACLDLGVRVDVLPTSRSFEEYDVVVAPVLHLVPAALRDRLVGFVERGGHLVTTYFSGIVDEHDHVWLDGYPGALRDVLGIRIEELAPLLDGEQVTLDDGRVGTLWTDRIEVTSEDTEVLAAYASGPQAGRPAITRRVPERGSATYVSTRLGAGGIAPVLATVLEHAGVESELPSALRGRVELTVRADETSEYWFVINRTAEDVDLAGLADAADVLLSTAGDEEALRSLPGRGVAVLVPR
ncbi:beta-galactosidase [Nocardioides pocheonensis]|uniref:Beta-galactosidase n=1 Tax=Nocardioides pocheonensis TaxID=661485 RepID=A0A3N0GN39_9ACTN|nr:beta-galactosidase [Nocardioides pocheonensis]RNM13636.1 beta-galactosidase [Nocardioides pocheonensis]